MLPYLKWCTNTQWHRLYTKQCKWFQWNVHNPWKKRNIPLQNKINQNRKHTQKFGVILFEHRGCIKGHLLNDILSKINDIFVAGGWIEICKA